MQKNDVDLCIKFQIFKAFYHWNKVEFNINSWNIQRLNNENIGLLISSSYELVILIAMKIKWTWHENVTTESTSQIVRYLWTNSFAKLITPLDWFNEENNIQRQVGLPPTTDAKGHREIYIAFAPYTYTYTRYGIKRTDSWHKRRFAASKSHYVYHSASFGPSNFARARARVPSINLRGDNARKFNSRLFDCSTDIWYSCSLNSPLCDRGKCL